ncbi:MAG: hypothetical protein PHC88_10930 [Terrimicrobiaceae bacterium]|nr:hypothetical protein [Terrimicrobiaceae bacterium]
MIMLIYRALLFAAATLAFVVLYDRGPADYPRKAGEELQAMAGWIRGATGL